MPAGRITVARRGGVTLLAGLDPWLERVRRAGTGGIAATHRAVEQALFTHARTGRAADLVAVFAALGGCHEAVASSGTARRETGPLLLTTGTALLAELLPAAREDVGLRVALALACAHDHPRSAPTMSGLRPLLSPVAVDRGRVVWTDRATPARLAGGLFGALTGAARRRGFPDATGDDGDVVPAVAGTRLGFDRGPALAPDDLAALARGGIDERRCATLLAGLLTVDWSAVSLAWLPTGGHARHAGSRRGPARPVHRRRAGRDHRPGRHDPDAAAARPRLAHPARRRTHRPGPRRRRPPHPQAAARDRPGRRRAARHAPGRGAARPHHRTDQASRAGPGRGAAPTPAGHARHHRRLRGDHPVTDRLIYDAEMTPVLGSAFQPTGFPDIGAATFTRFDGDTEVSALLVESVQSMANRLEATAWDDATNQPVAEVTGLPWVRVERDGPFLTSSRQEAHRLASPFVRLATLDGTPMLEVIAQRLDLAADTPHDRRAMAAAVAALDPFCLLHGVFFSDKKWPGQPRYARAVSAVIEAHDVQRLDSGGRKSDRVRHQIEDRTGGGTAEGYGSVPFHRTEWTAKRIIASFVVDVELLRSYGLPGPVTETLETLAQWEIRALLTGGLRLRTACDLEIVGDAVPRRGDTLPKLDELTGRLRELIPACGAVFGDGTPLTVAWAPPKASAKTVAKAKA